MSSRHWRGLAAVPCRKTRGATGWQVLLVTAIFLSERCREDVGAGEADVSQHEVVEAPHMIFGVSVVSARAKTASRFSVRCCSAGRCEPPCENAQCPGLGPR